VVFTGHRSKEFAEHDYVYDVAKLMTSLHGSRHADIGENERGNREMGWTNCEAGKIAFDCFSERSTDQSWPREACDVLKPWHSVMA